MSQFDQTLEQLALEAQRHYHVDSRSKTKRQKALAELMSTMFPRTRQDADFYPNYKEARKRIAQIKKMLREDHLELGNRFEDCFQEAISQAQLEVCQKIDVYNRWIDFRFFRVWQEMCLQVLQSEGTFNLEHISWLRFTKKIEQFLEKQPKKRNYSTEKTQTFTNICRQFIEQVEQSIVIRKGNLYDLWEDFCDRLNELDERNTPVWEWFKFYLEKRFQDKKKEYLNIIQNSDGTISVICSLDAPVYNEEIEGGSTTTLGDILPDRENDSSPSEIVRIIKEDPDEIFQKKCVKDFPHINFQSVALLIVQGCTWEQIEIYFGRVVSGAKTVCPFMTRKDYGCLDYFRPIIVEYLQSDLILSDKIIQQIEEDIDGKYRKKIIKRTGISFRDAIVQRKKSGSWRISAQELKFLSGDLILDYLDSLRHFDLGSG